MLYQGTDPGGLNDDVMKVPDPSHGGEHLKKELRFEAKRHLSFSSLTGSRITRSYDAAGKYSKAKFAEWFRIDLPGTDCDACIWDA